MCKTYFYPAGTKVYDVYQYSEDLGIWSWRKTLSLAPEKEIPDVSGYRCELKYVYTEDTWEGAWYGGDANSWKPYTYVMEDTPDDINKPVPETTTTEAASATKETTTSTDVVYNIPLLTADNNGDGSVNASDAAAILLYASL